MPRGMILLVDDDVSWSEMAAGVLREAGFDVHLAHDGDRAAALLEREAPALVILDVHLPRFSGFQLLKDFRQRNRSTPVVMISGDDQVRSQDRALAEGASAFLRKPFALDLLVKAVLKHVEGTAKSATGNGSGGEACGT
jgi:DNA-binding response OmpR family regulator